MIKKILIRSMSDIWGAERKFNLFQTIAFYLIAILAFTAIVMIS